MSAIRQAVDELRAYAAKAAQDREEKARHASMDETDPDEELGQAKAYEDVAKRLDKLLQENP